MFDDLTPPILQPPPHGFSIVGHQPPMMMNACLNYQTEMRYGYTTGYRLAADKLVAEIEATQTNQDFLVYPIIFLYRHHLELSLKDLLKELWRMRRKPHHPPAGHDLLYLWSQCLPDLKDVAPDEVKWFESIESLFKQLAAIDPKGDAFRYSIDRDHDPHLQGISHINLLRVKEVVGVVSDWLSGAVDYAGELAKYADEFG